MSTSFKKSLIWLLAAANLILLAVCAVLYLRTDRSAPELTFSENDAIYRSGMKEEALLMGVTAYDNRDGDVTDRVVVEKISENRKENKAVVFYAVSDRRNNVARASREFPANFGESLLQAGTELFSEATTDAGNAMQSETPEPEASSAPTASPEPTASPVPTANSEPTATPARTPRPTQTPQEAAPAEAPNADAATPAPRNDIPPTLTLKVTTVKVAAGTGPAWVDVIRQLSDDKDSYETLFHNLTVSKYDRNTPGTYAVTVQTKDSDGNVSAAQPLTIIVE